MLSKYIILLVLIAFSCISSDNELIEIDPRDFVFNKITLSDVGDDIVYIPLDNSIPFTNFKYVITQSYLYFAAKDIGILQFDRGGRLIRKIGGRGRGPGEFVYGMDFTVDERSGNVYVLDPEKIKIYSHNGVFLRDISYAGTDLKNFDFPGDIELFNSLIFLPDYLMRGDSKFNWIFLDTIGNLVSKKENSIPQFDVNVVRQGSIYEFEDKLFYYNNFNDTIFSILPDLTYRKALLFAKGSFRWPRGKILTGSSEQFSSRIYSLFQPLSMFETRKFIVLRYIYLDQNAISFIVKKTNEVYLAIKYEKVLEDKVYSTPCLLNDLDGGIYFDNINYYSESGEEYITTIINPSNLIAYISSKEFINNNPKYPSKKKELEKLASNLKETDNPILVLVRLKK